MKRVLAGFNGSETSCDALLLARAFAHTSGAELIVACVYTDGPMLQDCGLFAPIPGEWESVAERQERYERLEDIFARAREILGEMPFARADGLGSVAGELQRIAAEERADLIVLGSSSRGWAGRIHPGTAGERILTGSPCAVAIAPRGFSSRGAHAFRRIGVAYNGSEESKLAVAAARAIATDGGGTVRLIAALRPEIPNLMMSLHMSMVKKRLREALETAVAEIGDAEAEMDVVEADPAIALEFAAAKLDLLVVGSRGYGPVRSVLLGSVSEALARTVPCPMLITPRGSERHDGARRGDAPARAGAGAGRT